MTIRIPWQVLGAALLVLIAWGGAAGIAYLVAGDDSSDYINCTNDALQKHIDTYEQLQRTRPEAPESPGSGASSAAWDAYSQQFSQYEREAERHRELGDDVTRTYNEETRECEDFL